MLASLDELAIECVDDTANAQIKEAINCYQGGAYRAAIVAAYVAVCFDLIQKLRTLAASGDGEATQAVEQLENLQDRNDQNDPQAIKGLLAFERGLLEKFRDKFDFFGRNEFDELERLRTDRNRCAHPTFLKNSLPFAPFAESARLHIRNALVLVLTQQPKHGKAALVSLQALILSSYFPTKASDAVTRLKGSEIHKARTPLITGFVDLMCFGWPDSASPLHKQQAAIAALVATVELHRTEALPRLIQNMNKLLMETVPLAVEFGCFLALRLPELGEQVNEPGRPLVKNWLMSPTLGATRGEAVKHALSIEWLKDSTEDALMQMKAEDFGEISEEIPAQMATAAAKLYSSAKNWNEANNYASRFAISYASWFSESDLDLIFTEATVGGADLEDSHGFKEFIAALTSQDGNRSAQVRAQLERHGLGRFMPDE